MPSARNRLLAAALACAILAPQPALAQSATDQADMAALATGQADTAPVSTNIFAIPAKKLFGRQKTSAHLKAQAIGAYALGCMAGGQQLPVTGDTWQVMRLSRNRNWGTPQLIALIEKLSAEAKAKAGWNGFLVGDMAQPRGGPMLTGHASHQIGLDADIWFTPMPDHTLTTSERETMVPLEMVKDHKTLNADNWSEARARLLQTVAQDPEVARIFVHPPIKAEMCRWAKGPDRSWLAKLRPLYGHTFHFHVRMKCPEGMSACKNQWTPKPDDGTGCGKELAYWYSDAPWTPHKPPPGPKRPPPPPLTLAGLPAECRAVIAAP
ncbi:MAG: penicillin-insensitive murein endopeptidase [Alphaproteobacteria bacterium]|nr:penicillin-insensitive murein endopeptidase [Alphaproteobacteria bacterium]